MKRGWMFAVVAVVIARARCGDSPKQPIDVEAVNALVPAELADRLVFEERALVRQTGRRSKITYRVAAPRGWIAGFEGEAELRHPDTTYFFTTFHLGYNCDGWCEPRDWNAVIDKVYAQYLRGHVTKNVKGDTSRILIGQRPDGGTTAVVVAHWKAGADHYEVCEAALEKDFQAAAHAFEKACEVVDKN